MELLKALNSDIKKAIISHAQQETPRESVGFLLWNEEQDYFYQPLKNIHDNSTHFFRVDSSDFLKYEIDSLNKLIALVHSHPTGEKKLSLADITTQYHLQTDFILYSFDGLNLQIFPKIEPLTGREFKHGEKDCYSLIKDFYYLNGIELQDFARGENWWKNGENLYLDNIEQQGFYKVDLDSVQYGDILLFSIGKTDFERPNHGAIFAENQEILHHYPQRLSRKDLLDGALLKRLHTIWRHKKWQKLTSDFMGF